MSDPPRRLRDLGPYQRVMVHAIAERLGLVSDGDCLRRYCTNLSHEWVLAELWSTPEALAEHMRTADPLAGLLGG